MKHLVGMKFNRLLVIELESMNKWGQPRWNCLCDCGNKITTISSHLFSGNTKSCGCLKKETDVIAPTKHGMYRTPTYETWRSMLRRCYNSNEIHWDRYGGRGITVCDRWREFQNFFEDMGERPEGLTLDRIDNDGNYEPGNCRWATKKEQASNRAKRRNVEI
jgi:hypothetical protein